ncbi:MAG: hypothetical protein PQJ46_01345 [Spirochaetales bacterium]|nr:hypothetical protein [Spirochaetales bacterium]
MLIRYGTNEKGKRVKIANIYTVDEHGITGDKIDKDAFKIIRKLKNAGFDAYVVGGAVRDLLIGRTPKDFDIVTDAHPRQIKKLFWNARIIGRRFRLVHIHYDEKIIEVSTYRGLNPGDEQNIFGSSLEDDVKRRDFSFNALYYSPIDEQVIDYVNGYKDVMHKKITSLIPLDVTFVEDPVRLIRAVKYAATTGFVVPGKLKKALKKYSTELDRVSVSRITEELLKILASGHSREIFEYCAEYNILQFIVPKVAENLDDSVLESLERLDNEIENNGGVGRGFMLYSLVRPFLKPPSKAMVKAKIAFREVFKDAKAVIAPLTPPNIEVEKAVVFYFKELGLPVRSSNNNRGKKNRNRRGRRPSHKTTKKPNMNNSKVTITTKNES